MNAKEKYELFLKETPYLEKKLQQQHIASYLGITPQSFSRLKNSFSGLD